MAHSGDCGHTASVDAAPLISVAYDHNHHQTHHTHLNVSTDPATDFAFGAPALQQQIQPPPSYGSIALPQSGRVLSNAANEVVDFIFKVVFLIVFCVLAGFFILLMADGKPPGW